MKDSWVVMLIQQYLIFNTGLIRTSVLLSRDNKRGRKEERNKWIKEFRKENIEFRKEDFKFRKNTEVRKEDTEVSK